jgi:hypothetical protein
MYSYIISLYIIYIMTVFIFNVSRVIHRGADRGPRGQLDRSSQRCPDYYNKACSNYNVMNMVILWSEHAILCLVEFHVRHITCIFIHYIIVIYIDSALLRMNVERALLY